ncbi:MAG: NAD(P)/FAD-dependent oxidoreductase [Candidatus Nanopelagicales bacterium]
MHVDVAIIGAGLSGVGAACHLTRRLPDKTFVVLEARDALGGTWDLFRYPGIRSDSDMFTLGYAFRPWTAPKAIADGDTILTYIADTAAEYGVTDRIRYHRKVVRADWSGQDRRWTLTLQHTDDPSAPTSTMTADFVYGCTGYYDYDNGYTPDLPGLASFAGPVVHAQHWPADLDYAGKRVVVVGSGATAVTIVPAMAATAGRVTMLQRSPTHILPLPATDPIADWARRRLPAKAAYRMIRTKNVLVQQLSFQFSRRRPEVMRRFIHDEQAKILPADYPFDPNLTPRYDPWDQRLCLAADGDLFHAIADGSAEIVTGNIDTFTPGGVRLSSGDTIDADVVVLATGLTLLPFGGITIVVDGRQVDQRDEVTYRGAMLTGVPNLVFAVGYTNASWTLKADLVADYFCRLLRYLDRHGYDEVIPQRPPDGAGEPIIDLKSGYVARALDRLPRQGHAWPWRLRQNYPLDLITMRYGRLRDRGVRFVAQRTKSGSRRSSTSSSRVRSS